MLGSLAIEEERHRHAEHFRGPLESPGGNAVLATFVLLQLLIAHADLPAELLLRQTHLQTLSAKPAPGLNVARIRLASWGRTLGHRAWPGAVDMKTSFCVTQPTANESVGDDQ